MIISRTPYRISFLGGGTDYAPWYQKHGGAVLSTTINHYAYITARWLPPFHAEKSRIIWSQIESVMHHSDILHPSVRATLKYLGIENGVEIHHSGDLPARSGLGSSSTFTVGILNALSALQGKSFNKAGLAMEAVHIEREILKENVGIQDQIAAAYGGLNKTIIHTDSSFLVSPLCLDKSRMEELQNHCLLFFTGISRTASDIANEQIKNTVSGDKDIELKMMQELVSESLSLLNSNTPITEFGKLLHVSWRLKRSLAKNISSEFIDKIYDLAWNAGALGGKLLGAGGGGFMLFFAPPENHDNIRTALKDFLWVPFKFENEGSKIIFNDPNSYSRESLTRRNYSHGI